MNWDFIKDAVAHYSARRQLKNLQTLHRLKDRHMDMLLAMASCLDHHADEISLSLTVRDLGRRAGLTPSSAKRVLADLHDRGFIVRHQPERIAGCEAITTLLPLAFEALGYDIGLERGECGDEVPEPIRRAVCGQPPAVVMEVCAAWLQGRDLDQGVMAEFRGQWPAAAQAAFDARIAPANEEAPADGLETISTVDGTVAVDPAALEAALPGQVSWSFIRDVMAEVAWRDGCRVTAQTLPTLIAEAAYSRAYAPFCRDLPWREAVWRLGSVMARETWSRPRRIWDQWYAAAERACGAIVDRKTALASVPSTLQEPSGGQVCAAL